VPTDLSPDGTRFVFLRYRYGNAPSGQLALFIENISGTGLRQITPYGLPQAPWIGSAQWSPDGKEIISETTAGRLFVVRPDGTHVTRIRLNVHTAQYFAFEPHWSPDGKRIVFGMTIKDRVDLYTAKIDGSDVVRITNTPVVENGPDWQSIAASS
jgi:TolB protein